MMDPRPAFYIGVGLLLLACLIWPDPPWHRPHHRRGPYMARHAEDKDRPPPLRLTDKAVKEGAWIDNGAWATDGQQQRQVSRDEPVIMWRGNAYTDEQARERGWIV